MRRCRPVFRTRCADTGGSPRLIKLNRPLALQLGLDPDWLPAPEGTEMLAGNRMPEGADPIAMAYAGHQFGHFVPQLGDGRAILLGEVIDADGIRRDIQLKGSGPTPFSRRGDGRAALGPVLREYIVSEAMAALGIPTTRALAAVMTGENVVRETPLPGAVLTRVASSHIRVGTFQYLRRARRYRGRAAARRSCDRPALSGSGRRRTPLSRASGGVIARQAELVARWLLVGFIHGVMNTDNTSISGETIDYGPCAFMDAYDPATVFSSIDEQGRYAYANQPQIALWNLTRLAECLLPLLSDDQEEAIAEAQSALGEFSEKFDAAYQAGLRRKLGLFTRARWRSGAGAGPAGCDGQEPGRFYPDVPASVRCGGSIPQTIRKSGNYLPIPRPMTAGLRAGAGGHRGGAADRRSAADRDARGQSRLHSPQSPDRGRDRCRGKPERLRTLRGAPDSAGKTLRGPAGICRAMPSRPSQISACFRHFAGRDPLTPRPTLCRRPGRPSGN